LRIRLAKSHLDATAKGAPTYSQGEVRLKKGYLSENEPDKRLHKLARPVRTEGRQHFCKIPGPKTTQINPKKNTR
jgi:hypothetical protein